MTLFSRLEECAWLRQFLWLGVAGQIGTTCGFGELYLAGHRWLDLIVAVDRAKLGFLQNDLS